MSTIRFLPFKSRQSTACLALFDANCPAYFLPEERTEYEDFLREQPTDYEVCMIDQRVVGAFGLIDGRLNWMVVEPAHQGRGIGSAAMARLLAKASVLGLQSIGLATSHKTAAFFAAQGASTQAFAQDGWGRGMHRVDMVLRLPQPGLQT